MSVKIKWYAVFSDFTDLSRGLIVDEDNKPQNILGCYSVFEVVRKDEVLKLQIANSVLEAKLKKCIEQRNDVIESLVGSDQADMKDAQSIYDYELNAITAESINKGE